MSCLDNLYQVPVNEGTHTYAQIHDYLDNRLARENKISINDGDKMTHAAYVKKPIYGKLVNKIMNKFSPNLLSTNNVEPDKAYSEKRGYKK